MKHTCEIQGRSNCAACMQFEIELWEAINRYASSCGGDPAGHAHGNVPRMQAVTDVTSVLRKHNHPAVISGTQGGLQLPTNPDCTGTVGKDFVQCGEEGYYCSDRCWTIGRLLAAQAQVASYEQQLGVHHTGSSTTGQTSPAASASVAVLHLDALGHEREGA